MKRRLRRFMPRPPRMAPLAISIMLTLTVLVPVAVVVMPGIHRWWRIEGLTSADEARQRRSLGYVIANADDPRVVQSVVARLDTPNDDAFTQLVLVLDAIGRWDRPTVGDDAWVRWIGQIADAPSPEARIAAAQHLADLYALADDARVIAALDRMASDAEGDVRFNALVAAAELYGASRGTYEEAYAGTSGSAYRTIIIRLTADPQPAIARDAWLLAGLIGSPPALPAEWSTAAPEVVEAIEWATAPGTSPAPGTPRPTLDDITFPDTLEGYRDWFTSPLSTVRDVMALEASLRFPPEQLEPYIASLLTDYNDHAKMAGGILAGLTGLQGDLLRKRHEAEDIAQVKQVLRLALWMQGDDSAIDLATAQSLLAREDFESRSTVLLAMLRVRQRSSPGSAARVALDFLLNPRGEPTINLIELFDTLRWWRIMEHELPRLFPDARGPNHQGPMFSVWAEPGAQRLQLDVLRHWYLLHRHALTP